MAHEQAMINTAAAMMKAAATPTGVVSLPTSAGA